MAVERSVDGARPHIPGEALRIGSPRHARTNVVQRLRGWRQREGAAARILLALTAMLGLMVAIPAAVPSSAAGAAVSTVRNASGFPTYFEDVNGVRLDPCLDTQDSHCPLLPTPGVFDTQQPIVFPTNFPDEFFYSVVESDRLPTPGCVGAADPTAAAPGTVQVRLALEGAFGGGLPAINDQMVFARIRFVVVGGLCPLTTYTFTHPYGTMDLTTDATGSIKPSPGTTDVGCAPTTQTACDFGIALTSTMLQTGFLRWDPAFAPLADPGYLGGDIDTFHEITGGINNHFTVTDSLGATVATTNLFTVAGRIAGPVAAEPQAIDFGGVQVGQTGTQNVTLTNIGADPWFYTGVTTDAADFGVTNLDCPTALPGLARDETCQIQVTFTPAAVGPRGFDGTVHSIVAHSGLHSPFTLTLQGTGINPGEEADLLLNPTALSFGQVRVGLLSTSQTVTIANPGAAPLQVLDLEFVNVNGSPPGEPVSFDSLDKDAFRITFDGCAGVVVPAGGVEHCDVLVAFQPTAAHPYVAALKVTANTSGGPREVTLQATGIGGVAAVSKDTNGNVLLDPTNGFPVWYQDELGQRVGQCLDALDPNCLVLPDDFYTGGIVGGIEGGGYVNFPEEFFWYQAESEPVETNGCGGLPGAAFVVIAAEGAFSNGPPIVGDAASFGRVRISADGLCPNTTYTVVHPYGQVDVSTDNRGRVRRGLGTQDIGCLPAPGDECNWMEALPSPVFGGFLRQVNAPAGYLGNPNLSQAVSGSPYIAQREIDAAGPGGTPTAANYFRIYQTDNPAAFEAETNLFTVMGKLVGPMMATPSSLSFGQVEVASASGPQTVTITNDGAAPVDVTGITVGGLMPADFTIVTDGCTGQHLEAFALNPSAATCDLQVVFTPSANGPRTAQIGITHTALNNPLFVNVSGVGGAAAGFAAISVNPISVEFPQLHIDQVSASESIRVSNVGGSADLVIDTVTIGGLDTTQFVVTENGCAVPVPPNGECVIRVAFAPTVTGDLSAELLLDHNAPLVADPLPVPLAGRGFGGSAAQSAGLTQSGFPSWFQDNNGVRVEACLQQGDPGCILLSDAGYNPALPLVFPTNFPSEMFWYMAETDPTFQVVDGTCGAIGTASVRVAVEGTFGTGSPLPGDQLSFGRVRIGVAGLCANSTYQFVHPYGTTQLTTDGAGDGADTADLTNIVANRPLSGLPDQASGGGLLRWDPVDSPPAPEGYLGDAATFHTVVGSTYRPDGPGTEPANYFEISPVDEFGVAGTRLARNDRFMVAGKQAGPLESNVTALAYGPQAQGTTSVSQTITVTNLFPADVTVTPTLGGADAAAFSVTGGTCGAGATIAPDTSCTIQVALSPSAVEPTGAKSASIVINHDSIRGPITVTLTGTVTDPGQPEITVTPVTHAFGNQNVNTTSAVRTVAISNTGTAPLAVNGVVVGGTNANQFNVVNNCPVSLAVGAPACSLSVTFRPTSNGNKVAQIQIQSDDPVRPSVFVALSGSGVAPQVSVSPTSLSLSTKGTTSKSVTLTNTGTAPLSLVGAPAITIVASGLPTSNTTKFTAANNGCNNVAPGASCRINVTFNPGAGPSNQVFTATLRVTTNAVNSPTTVALTGQRK